MGVLGVEDHRWLGFEDGCLAGVDPETGTEQVVALIDDVSPDTILTFGPDGMTFHSDHITISRWATMAWQQRGCPGRLLYAMLPVDHYRRFGAIYEEWGVYMSDERPSGVHLDELAVYLRLDGWQLDRKLTALAAMASQTGAVMATIDPDLYRSIVAEEAFVDAVDSTARNPSERAPMGAR
jgi:LmbE family N-acetylglucosaminyl deacetylase